jgi:hypothetical protein
MYFTYRANIIVAALTLFSNTAFAQSEPPSEVIHTYELIVNNSALQPIEGAVVSFFVTVDRRTPSEETKCVTDVNGKCKLELKVVKSSLSSPTFNLYTSSLRYSVSKAGFYSVESSDKLRQSEPGAALVSGYGSTPPKSTGDTPEDRSFPAVKTGTVILYSPVDYFSNAFATSSADRTLRDQALKFISLIRLQTLMTDADLIRGGMGTTLFKSKKYFQIKVNTTTTFNSLKFDKYGIGKRLFDDSIRKILNPLNENISNPKLFHGYDLIIYGYSKSFGEKDASPEKIEYRFLIPQDTVRRYKDKDISGQQVLDASVILMNDERIELKLQ